MKSLYIVLTAHDPLERVDVTLKVLEAYEKLPVKVTVDIFIDYLHEQDLDEFISLVDKADISFDVSYYVADEEYEGYYLCWAHKPVLKEFIKDECYDFYMYSENDMLFTKDNFLYWLNNKDKLKELNLEPGFCRFETYDGLKIPFDNYRKWSISRPTPNCWGSIPHNGSFYLTLTDSRQLGWFTLGNPYGGLMLLDQEDASKYIRSASSDPVESYRLTGKRNWPIADRSSMGLCFDDLLPGQEHRRVVPVRKEGENLVVPDCALVEHLDCKYSKTLVEKGDIITTNSMLAY